MGSGISDNYSDINPTFTSRFWKVHSAIRKSTGLPVSLWLLDSKEIKKAMKSKAEVQKFTDSCIEAVNKLRRIHHPNILQINEISDNPKQFGFSAEPVESTLELDKEINTDDITYIADQLAQVMTFLHGKVNLLHLGISPDAICLTKSIQIKLAAFNYSTPFIGTPTKSIYGDYIENLGHPEIIYTAPEYLQNEGNLTTAADVYSYGATLFFAYNNRKPVYMAQTVEEVMATVSAEAFKTPTTMSEPMHDLLMKCIKFAPEERPKVEDILKAPAFLQLSIRSLRFMNLLMTKDNNDKMHFYQGVTRSLPLFSDRLLRFYFLPVFVDEIKNNIFYGPTLIPVIFSIGSKLETDLFMQHVILPLKDVLKLTDPPALAIATLNSVNIIVKKVPEDHQFGLIYPIFIGSLQSPSHELRMEAIKHIPSVVQTMSEQSIMSSLLPTLLDFVSTFDEPDIVCSVIECIEKSATKVNNDKFVFLIIPKLIVCWIRLPNSSIAESIYKLLSNIRPSITSSMKFVIPMATAIISSSGLSHEISAKMCDLVIGIVNRLKNERNLEERAENWVPIDSGTKEEHIVAPVKVQNLDIKEIEMARRRSSTQETSSTSSTTTATSTNINININNNNIPNPAVSASGMTPSSVQNIVSNTATNSLSIEQTQQQQQEQPKKKFSIFGFGRKKSGESGNEAESAATPVQPHVGPPGPLPTTGVGSASYASELGSSSQVPLPTTFVPHGGPPGPPPPMPSHLMMQQQGQYNAPPAPQTPYGQPPTSPTSPTSPTYGTYGSSQQSYQPPQPTYQPPQPTYQPPQPTYQPPQPTYQPPQPTYQPPQPTYQPPQPTYQPPQQQEQQRQQPQGANLFAGLSAGPAPKKSTNQASLFNGLALRGKK